MKKLIITTLCFLLNATLLFSQKKTLLKVEIPVSMMTEDSFLPWAQKVSIMFPTVYIPLHKHLDIGAGYTTPTFNYYVSDHNTVDNSYKFYKGNIKYKVTSFYFKINLSASQKRVNPFFSYVLSLCKGTYTAATPDSTSTYYQHNAGGFGGYDQYGYNKFAYGTRMTPQEEEVLKKALGKSQIAHGVQIGLDYKILPFLNLFAKVATFSVMGYNYNGYKEEQAFAYNYKDETKKYMGSNMEYYMMGIVLKIDAGKKSLIK